MSRGTELERSWWTTYAYLADERRLTLKIGLNLLTKRRVLCELLLEHGLERSATGSHQLRRDVILESRAW